MTRYAERKILGGNQTQQTNGLS